MGFGPPGPPTWGVNDGASFVSPGYPLGVWGPGGPKHHSPNTLRDMVRWIAEGIPIPEAAWRDLVALAEELGVLDPRWET